MKTLLSTLVVLFSFVFGQAHSEQPKKINKQKKIVTAAKQIYLPEYPGSCNPSIIKYKDSYLMTFRYLPNRYDLSWVSYIGVVLLDESFDPITPPQLLNARVGNKKTPSQSEDARIFACNDRFYLIYNDNPEVTFPSSGDRRDMYIAEITEENGEFTLQQPIKLIHEDKYANVLWQKNWCPFDWNGQILLSYSQNPHEVLYPNLDSGICQSIYNTRKSIQWYLGRLKGGTPPQKIGDNYYLTFFHSGVYTSSTCSYDRDLWHYYMGAYLFSADPPFAIDKMSPAPIDAPGFYTFSNHEKRIIYPGGFVVEGSTIYLAYGKDDAEVWIATIDLNNLLESMVPVYD